MVKKILQSLALRLNWQPNFWTFMEIGLLLAVYPLMQLGHAQWFVENGIIENLQLGVLLVVMTIACRAKFERKLFIFAALVVLFMLLREVNFGRPYLCEYYGISRDMCSWNVFKYGTVAKILRLLFALAIGLYFVTHKLYKTVVKYLLHAPVFFYEIAVLSLAVIGGTIAEFPFIDNEIFEESCELISYITLGNLIWRYSRISPEAA